MKKTKQLKVLMSLLLGIGLFLIFNQGVKAGVGDTIAETFPDPNMAQAVADDLTSGDVNVEITQSMVDNTFIMNYPNRGIKDLTGIDTFTELQTLHVYHNEIQRLPAGITNLANLQNFYLYRNQITDLPQEQYDFISANPSNFFNDQTFIDDIDIGYLNTNYTFDIFPAQEQFLNYGMTFTYMLVNPDYDVTFLTPTFVNGQMTIPGAELDQEGTYFLEMHGVGGRLSPVFFEKSLEVGKSTPIIELTGDNPLTISQGSAFIDPGYTATDPADGNLTGQVIVTGTVDTATIGTYTLTYTVTNRFGNSDTAEREVIVIASVTPPQPPPEPPNNGSNGSGGSTVIKLPKTGQIGILLLGVSIAIAGGTTLVLSKKRIK